MHDHAPSSLLTSRQTRPRLSIVMPVYNEVALVAEVVRRVRAAALLSGLSYEIVAVDDASTDGSGEVLSALRDAGRIRLLVQPCNQGKGAALRAGFAAATGEIVLVQDADFEYDPSDYPALLRPLLAGTADVVFGVRFGGGMSQALSWAHRAVNGFLTWFSNLMTGLSLSDMEVGYKVFRREVLRSIDIESDRFGVEPELVAKVAAGGWRVGQVPISYHPRTYAEGKKIGWRDGVEAVYDIAHFGLKARFAAHFGARVPVLDSHRPA